MQQKELSALQNIVRLGTVSSINPANRTARVTFADKDNLVSGALKILQNTPFIGGIASQTEETEGGTDEATFEKHRHKLIITPWLPYVGQMVVCIYLPNGESDGFVIGGL